MQALKDVKTTLFVPFWYQPFRYWIILAKILLTSTTQKAAGIAGLTCEHLQFIHPVLPVALPKLFKVIFQCQCVQSGLN